MNIIKTNAMMRLKRELDDLNKNPIENLSLTVGLIDDNNLFEWQCTLKGPSDSYYAGGLFYLQIFFPENYPNKSPEICFKTPIYHLNVNPNNCENSSSPEKLGHVCLSTLNWWKPEYTMRKVLSNVFSLLYRENPGSAYGQNRREEYEKHKDLYEEKAKYFTKIYANPSRVKDPDYFDKWDFSQY